jgi:hypothetical protein
MSVTIPLFAEKRPMKQIGPVYVFVNCAFGARNLSESSASRCDKADPAIKTRDTSQSGCAVDATTPPACGRGLSGCPAPTPYLCLSFATLDGFVSRTVTFRLHMIA